MRTTSLYIIELKDIMSKKEMFYEIVDFRGSMSWFAAGNSLVY